MQPTLPMMHFIRGGRRGQRIIPIRAGHHPLAQPGAQPPLPLARFSSSISKCGGALEGTGRQLSTSMTRVYMRVSGACPRRCRWAPSIQEYRLPPENGLVRAITRSCSFVSQAQSVRGNKRSGLPEFVLLSVTYWRVIVATEYRHDFEETRRHSTETSWRNNANRYAEG